MDIEWLNRLRRFELEKALILVPVAKGKFWLEVGAGTGYQAKLIQDRGFGVRAIDVGSSSYRHWRQFPVEDYDGVTVPARDGEFDVVFSSNVLEHIPHIDSFLRGEMKRVLRDEGIAIHIVPSASWRFWTSVTHYLDVPRRLWRYIRKTVGHRSDLTTMDASNDQRTRSISERVVGILFPCRHGERGGSLSELYLFSRLGWRQLFESTGWFVVDRISSGIFYTGVGVLGRALPINIRQRLARFLGSSTHIYVLRKARK
ncbi:MAG: class I SAM-dependent methyltransferase [Nitrospirae bacterium]|nr:MAG: class I SAM-dependent methyltransferase [Nitrospirota bacterium]